MCFDGKALSTKFGKATKADFKAAMKKIQEVKSSACNFLTLENSRNGVWLGIQMQASRVSQIRLTVWEVKSFWWQILGKKSHVF